VAVGMDIGWPSTADDEARRDVRGWTGRPGGDRSAWTMSVRGAISVAVVVAGYAPPRRCQRTTDATAVAIARALAGTGTPWTRVVGVALTPRANARWVT
jgi:hypothetical protein